MPSTVGSDQRLLLAGLAVLALSAAAFLTLDMPGMLVLSIAIIVVLGAASRLFPEEARSVAALAWGAVVLVWFVWVTRDWSQYASSAVAHSAGGAAVALALTMSSFRRDDPHRLKSSAVLLIVGVIGVGWELVEFLSDRLFGTALSGGKLDTALDLFWDVLGASGSVALSRALQTRRRRPTEITGS